MQAFSWAVPVVSFAYPTWGLICLAVCRKGDVGGRTAQPEGIHGTVVGDELLRIDAEEFCAARVFFIVRYGSRCRQRLELGLAVQLLFSMSDGPRCLRRRDLWRLGPRLSLCLCLSDRIIAWSSQSLLLLFCPWILPLLGIEGPFEMRSENEWCPSSQVLQRYRFNSPPLRRGVLCIVGLGWRLLNEVVWVNWRGVEVQSPFEVRM